MQQLFSNLVTLVQRVEGALIFTIVRFLHSTLLEYFERDFVLFFNVSLIALSVFFMGLCRRYPGRIQDNLLDLVRIVRKFGTLVLTQELIRSVQPDDLSNRGTVTLLQCLTSSVSLVILLNLLPQAFQSSENGQQFMRLVLYMFTDSTEFLVKRIQFGWTLPFLSMMGFVVLYHLKQRHSEDAIVLTLTRAFNISLTNMMILSSWTVNVVSSEKGAQIVQLISLLVLFDVVSKRYPEFEAMREYAVWQGASQLYTVSVTQGVSSFTFVSSIVFVIITLQVLQAPVSDAITELGVLSVTNVLIGQVQAMLRTLHSNDITTVIFLWLIVVEVVLRLLKAPD